MNILIAPFVNGLFGLYYLLGNLGWAVVVITVLIRLILMPLVFPSLKSAEKMRELQPKLKKLQEKYGKDKEGLAKAQMDMYKSEGVNPLSGCLPQILQIAVLIIFFQGFNMVVGFSEGKGTYESLNQLLVPAYQINKDFKFDPYFLGSDLRMTPSNIFGQGININLLLPLVLLLGSGLLQYWSAKKMMPSTPKVDESAYTKATPDKSDDMMEAMRTQSLYMMPAMTVFIGWNFSLGLLLYWFMNSVVMIGQQLAMERIKEQTPLVTTSSKRSPLDKGDRA
ncbi:YidC/Oxa1 family membrane protein insertase [Candidatus Shapirobacteria bacterium]|nr:YidC/Oxa1 family membrane protein insertase [Candidatus Shapirobacteria bacterium]